MDHAIFFELEHNRKRLNHFMQLKEKSQPKPPQSVDKWIEIYGERVQQLERRAHKLGLRTELGNLNRPDAAQKRA